MLPLTIAISNYDEYYSLLPIIKEMQQVHGLSSLIVLLALPVEVLEVPLDTNICRLPEVGAGVADLGELCSMVPACWPQEWKAVMVYGNSPTAAAVALQCGQLGKTVKLIHVGAGRRNISGFADLCGRIVDSVADYLFLDHDSQLAVVQGENVSGAVYVSGDPRVGFENFPWADGPRDRTYLEHLREIKASTAWCTADHLTILEAVNAGKPVVYMGKRTPYPWLEDAGRIFPATSRDEAAEWVGALERDAETLEAIREAYSEIYTDAAQRVASILSSSLHER
jgi:hypothetical protein